MKITLIGDIHGEWEKYRQLIAKSLYSVQLGDFGVGFGPIPNDLTNKANHWFIHGNHDKPTECAQMPNFLGRFGRGLPSIDHEIFFVSGAFSIDKAYRTIGIDWWDNEELSRSEWEQCLEMYKNAKPRIVLSHDCPSRLYPAVSNRKYHGSSLTAQALDAMLDIHCPEQWFFGHHHVKWTRKHKGCKFRCLNTLETFDLELM